MTRVTDYTYDRASRFANISEQLAVLTRHEPDRTAEQMEQDRLADKQPADCHWWGRDL